VLGSIMAGFPFPSEAQDEGSASAWESSAVPVPVPPEFRTLAGCFHQDMLLEGSTEAQWITDALECLDKSEERVVKQFLTELLRRNPEGNVLQALWYSTAADWSFPHDEELRGFLAMIRDAIQ
jgi:hypothetical protein